MRKKRILWVSEASFMNTGFSVLTYEILARLHATGKYEIAEFGSYAKSSDPRAQRLPWTFYGAIPEDHDQFSTERYNSSIYGQFGEALFEQVCLDFKPDIVIDVRDWWMCEFQLRSPFRKHFKLMWMPTVDGEPQRLEWLDSYSRADTILTYSKYGKDVLEREAPGKIKVFDIVRPGVNHEIYRPMDKKTIREQLGISQDANIIMTVMRNQRRKLYPDLIETFNDYIKYCVKRGRTDLAKNSYLFLHTSYPDVGFDISRHIMQNGLGHKIIMTYTCGLCHKFYVDFFQTELSICKHCGNLAAHMPNTNHGLSRQQLAEIMNIGDLYVQYSICEGLGMPIAEAKACGIPAMGIEYSATAEQVNAPGCIPIKVGKFFHEPIVETEQRRSLPDSEDAVKKIFSFFTLSKDARDKMGELARKDAAENYSFERSARIFEEAIDQTEVKDHSETWDNPTPQYIQDIDQLPKFNNNAEFVDWCIINILNKPELKSTYWRNDIIKSLNVGFTISRGGREQFTPEIAVNIFKKMANTYNFWENHRVQPFEKVDENIIRWELV